MHTRQHRQARRKAGNFVSMRGIALWCAMGLMLMLAACNETPAPPIKTFAPDEQTATIPSSTNTAVQPTPTAEALAALINGEAVTLAAFQAELERYQAAIGQEAGEEGKKQVMDNLVNLVLLSQAAAEQGFKADETLVQERLDRLVERLGGGQALQAWMDENGYMEADLRRDLARSIEAARMRDQIIAGVNPTADQIHARQILARSAEEAEGYYARLQAGAAFAALANQADPIAGGELGWFPRGTLFYPELEEAVFQLEPGAYTTVIQTPAGYHILLVIERDPARPLSPEALLQAQQQALSAWLEERRQESEVVIY
jgi:peptidyl-prolyl cis-trans isomerase C